MTKTIEDIRHNFTNTTVENWVEEQGFRFSRRSVRRVG
jgi:hypothetical protein